MSSSQWLLAQISCQGNSEEVMWKTFASKAPIISLPQNGKVQVHAAIKKQSSLMELKNDSKASATDIQKQTIIQVLLHSCWSRSIDSFIDLLLQLWMFSSIHQQVWRCCLSLDSRFKAYNSIRVLVLMICSSKKSDQRIRFRIRKSGDTFQMWAFCLLFWLWDGCNKQQYHWRKKLLQFSSEILEEAHPRLLATHFTALQ